MGTRGTVLHALWHGIGLMPDNIAAKKPAVGLERESESPWDAEQVFVFEARRVIGTNGHRAVRIFLVRRPPTAIATGVTIADIQPENPVGFQDPAYLRKNIRE